MFDYPKGQNSFPSSTFCRSALVTHEASYSVGVSGSLWVPLFVRERMGRRVRHPMPYTFEAWCLGKHRDSVVLRPTLNARAPREYEAN